MGPSPRAGLFVEALDVGIELLSIYPPYAAAPDLDGGKRPGAHECIDLRDADIEKSGHVLEGEEARLLGSSTGALLVYLSHKSRLAPNDGGYVDLPSFASV